MSRFAPLSGFKQWRLGTKLVSTFIASALLTLGVGLWEFINLKKVEAALGAVYTHNVLSIADLADLQKNIALHGRTIVRAMGQQRNPQQQLASLERADGYWSKAEEYL